MSFYVPVGPGIFRATPHTVGPWAPTDQHAGPPSALLVRALEGVLPAGDGWLARVSVDLLGAVSALPTAPARSPAARRRC